ncbi:putative neuropeptide Y receptor type 6 [Anneissia japonica]|uniref:putative neuropeptide Y receptor type 6 n=1 Tax=Anneissia japonica TaxID=1529436 RepID=UPI001425964B|nr:putative neuropeptide Y receptor type 6 [Anneissia japonica]
MESNIFTYGDVNQTGVIISIDQVNPNWATLGVILLCAFLFSTIFAFGLYGNICVLNVVRRGRQLQFSTRVLFGHLSVCHVLVLLIDVPVRTLTMIFNLDPKGIIINRLFCGIVGFSVAISGACAVWTSAAIATERFIAIYYPFNFRRLVSHRRILFAIISMWLFCLASFSMLPITESDVLVMAVRLDNESITSESLITIGSRHCVYLNDMSSLFTVIYYTYLLFAMLIIPNGITIVCYLLVIVKLSRKNINDVIGKRLKENRSFVKMMVCNLIVMFLFWLPFVYFHSYRLFAGDPRFSHIMFYFVFVILLIFIGFSITPYMYTCFSSNIGKMTVDSILWCRKHDTQSFRQTTLTRTLQTTADSTAFTTESLCAPSNGGRETEIFGLRNVANV